mmetsp:Transcript_10506/g.22456  ORF Transcript_10506/g.22456 Transcript_10506/m.22456 type:complete len:213 (-) Transcript_10506:102-740(-)
MESAQDEDGGVAHRGRHRRERARHAQRAHRHEPRRGGLGGGAGQGPLLQLLVWGRPVDRAHRPVAAAHPPRGLLLQVLLELVGCHRLHLGPLRRLRDHGVPHLGDPGGHLLLPGGQEGGGRGACAHPRGRTRPCPPAQESGDVGRTDNSESGDSPCRSDGNAKRPRGTGLWFWYGLFRHYACLRLLSELGPAYRVMREAHACRIFFCQVQHA